MVEAWPGGAAKSHWRYISPDGTAFSSVKHVQEAQQGARGEERRTEQRQGWEQQHWERQYAQGHAHEQQLAREQLRQIAQALGQPPQPQPQPQPPQPQPQPPQQAQQAQPQPQAPSPLAPVGGAAVVGRRIEGAFDVGGRTMWYDRAATRSPNPNPGPDH